MQIRKTYSDVNPKLLYDEVKDFVLKQGTTLGESKLETYLLPDDTSSFMFRGNLVFKIQTGQDRVEKECLRAHVVGAVKGETKMMFDINEELFPEEKITALQNDLDFIFGPYEAGIDEEED
jgi:hypothetical protein